MRTEHIDTYYTSTDNLLAAYDAEGRKYAFDAKSLNEYTIWKETVRTKLRQITGIDRMKICDPEPKLLESVKFDGYIRDKLLLQTEPSVYMPMYVLRPDDLKENEKRPCIIAPHGHVSAGKNAVAGRDDITAVKEVIQNSNYAYGVEFVKRGYVVFCPDARAFGERREWMLQGDEESKYLHSSCIQLNHMAICLGRSVTGMWTWDLMRLIDHIEARDDCDKDNICCAGLSGGGLQTLWLSALDDRIKCSVVSGYYYGYKDSLLKCSENCGCNYVPHLWEYVDMADLGALIAPRMLIIETGDLDYLNGERRMENVYEQVADTKKAYTLFNTEENFVHNVYHGEHKWYGQKAYGLIDKTLGRKGN